jgi:adenylylsulfate kinase
MKIEQGFGIWLTGMPSSGKSTITRSLVELLRERGVLPVVLESDTLRRTLTPEPTYAPEERDRFYRQMAELGALISRHGVPVIFDATANLRKYRDEGRSLIPHFVEVLVRCPLDECRRRDAKGIYAAAARGAASNVPGIQTEYEPPDAPEVTIDGRDDPAQNAGRIMDHLFPRSCI